MIDFTFQFVYSTMTNQTSNLVTVLGLVNGMIGGTILVLPIIGLGTGYIGSMLVCVVMGWISFYTAYLIIQHLGKSKSIKECILSHFKQDYRYFGGYSVFMWFSFIPYFVIYYRLICLQIQGLLGYTSSYIGPAVAVFLIIQVILIRQFHLGQQTLAYGIISIITYLLFLAWAQTTAPSGTSTIPAFGSPYRLASALQMAFGIQDFVMQNIIKNPNRHQYGQMIGQTFLIGILSYGFITYGSFAIVNRVPFKSQPQTIQDYFVGGGWQITTIELLYLVHLISVFPQFMIVSKIRFFQVFKIQLQYNIDFKQIVYIIFFILVSLLVFISGVYVQTMIAVNGAIVGYFYIVLIPIFIHFKCVFVDKSSGFIQQDDENNIQICMNQCQCSNRYSSRWTLYLQTVFLVFCIIIGLFLMVYTLIDVFQNNE